MDINNASINRDLERTRHQINLRLRHASALTKLMSERSDLRGVNALADLVDDSVRWCA